MDPFEKLNSFHSDPKLHLSLHATSTSTRVPSITESEQFSVHQVHRGAPAVSGFGVKGHEHNILPRPPIVVHRNSMPRTSAVYQYDQQHNRRDTSGYSGSTLVMARGSLASNHSSFSFSPGPRRIVTSQHSDIHSLFSPRVHTNGISPTTPGGQVFRSFTQRQQSTPHTVNSGVGLNLSSIQRTGEISGTQGLSTTQNIAWYQNQRQSTVKEDTTVALSPRNAPPTYQGKRYEADPNTRYTPNSVKAGQILGEYYEEYEVSRPKTIVKESIINKEVIVPETVRREETVEDVQLVRERIIQLEKKVKREKFVEVPEKVYKNVEVSHDVVIVEEKIKEVPKYETREVVEYVPKIQYIEKTLEVPEISYRDVEVEKIVEYPEIREEVVLKNRIVPRYVRVPKPVTKDVIVHQEVVRRVPDPQETIIHEEYTLPKISSVYEKVPIPIFAPRFVEVAVPVEQMDEETSKMAEDILDHVRSIAECNGPSLCDFEQFGMDVKGFDPRIEPLHARSSSAVALAIQHGKTMPRMFSTERPSESMRRPETQLSEFSERVVANTGRSHEAI